MEDYILNISPIDGRYRELTEDIREHFNEYNLIKNRIIVEIKWLQKMSELSNIKFELTDYEFTILEKIIQKFDLSECKRVKEIENETKHDVKAVEYYIDEKLREHKMIRFIPFVHFACTSEDINNLAYGLMISKLKKVYVRNAESLIEKIYEWCGYSKFDLINNEIRLYY